jgi:hypothetical protein
VLRRAEPGPGGLSAVVFGGAILAAVGAASFASFNFALADAADEETFEPAAAQALNILNGDFFFPIAVGFAAFFIAAGITILRTGGLARWLGWIALVIGIVAATPVGWFAFLVGLAWILAVSVMLAMRDDREETAPPSALPG